MEAVAWGGERLALAPAALERVAAGQAELLALLAGGARVYGVNTRRPPGRAGRPVDQDRPLGQDLAAVIVALERDELPLP